MSRHWRRWRPVDPADIALKAPIVEPDADAEAIFWDIRVDDGGRTIWSCRITFASRSSLSVAARNTAR